MQTGEPSQLLPPGNQGPKVRLLGPQGDSPCGLCVGSDLIVPLRDSALCDLHIKRPPLFTTPLLGCGREDGLIIELTHSIKRHPWLSESLVGDIVLGTKLRAPFIFSARL